MPRESSSALSVDAICERALNGTPPDAVQIKALLSVPSAEEAEPIFAAARELRQRHFGDAIFLSGFVYYTTYCRNLCNFCLYRVGNDVAPHYRKSLDEILATCRGLVEDGINLIDLTSGEDPLTHDTGNFIRTTRLSTPYTARRESPS